MQPKNNPAAVEQSMNINILKQIRKIIREETVSKEELKAAEERIKIEVKQAIDQSQEDTIESLSEVIHTGYNMHVERIKTGEEQLDILHSNNN